MATVISIVPYKFLPAKNGGQKFIALFNRYFSRQVTFVCVTVASNRNEEAEYETIPLLSDSFFRYMNPANFFRLKKLIKEKKATHVLIEHPYLGWLGLLLKKFAGVKLIVHSHNIEGIRFKTIGKWWWRLLWQYEKFIHRRADYNFFIQEDDKAYAVARFGLDEKKCTVVTYGIEQNTLPSKEEVDRAKQLVRVKHNISADKKILLFVGAFNYKPNRDAFDVTCSTICPQLDQLNFRYHFLVCGSGLNPESCSQPNLTVTGFVDDISVYFKAADVFVNPVKEGGGIKTKLVEALGWNVNAVSTKEGAVGISTEITGGKMKISENWQGFARDIISLSESRNQIAGIFYHDFYWENISEKAASFILQ